MNISNTQTPTACSNSSFSSSPESGHGFASYGQKKEVKKEVNLKEINKGRQVKLTGSTCSHEGPGSSSNQRSLRESTIAQLTGHMMEPPGLDGENLLYTLEKSGTACGLSTICSTSSSTTENKLLIQITQFKKAIKELKNQALRLETEKDDYLAKSKRIKLAELQEDQQGTEQKITELSKEKEQLMGKIRELTSKIDHYRSRLALLGGCPRIDCPTAVAANWSKNSVLFGK